MKIAVCLSGQLRTWKQCYDSWGMMFGELYSTQKHLFLNDKMEVHYFLHTWDFNSIPFSTWSKERDGKYDFEHPSIEADTTDEIEEFVKIIKPKLYLVEGKNKSITRKAELENRYHFRTGKWDWVPVSWSGAQLYGIMMSDHLKRRYELQNGFEYDVCVRLRPDLKFDDLNRKIFATDFKLPQPNTIYSVHSYNKEAFPYDNIGDVFFYTDSQTYDIMASLYNYLPQFDASEFGRGLTVEEMITYYARTYNMKNVRMKMDPTVVR